MRHNRGRPADTRGTGPRLTGARRPVGLGGAAPGGGERGEGRGEGNGFFDSALLLFSALQVSKKTF